MTYTVLVTSPRIAKEAVAVFESRGTKVLFTRAYAEEAELVALVKEHQPDGIISRMSKLTPAVMDAATRLRVISKTGIGVDNIDVAYATKKGIPVINGAGSNAQSVAEHAVAMIIGCLKDFVRLDRSMREGRWEKPNYQGTELAGKHVGLVGHGNNGRATARLLQAFGVRLSAVDPNVPAAHFMDGVRKVESIDDMIADVDVLTFHCPATPQTRHILNRDRLARMKPAAVVVNCSRGPVVDEYALADALRDRTIAAAGVDVFDPEPPAPDHPLCRLDNVLLSPHVAGVTKESGVRAGVMAAENLLAILDGKPIDLACAINPQALPPACRAA